MWGSVTCAVGQKVFTSQVTDNITTTSKVNIALLHNMDSTAAADKPLSTGDDVSASAADKEQKKAQKENPLDECENCSIVLGIDGVTQNQCGGCENVFYCNRRCQKAHWKKNHKYFCISKADQAFFYSLNLTQSLEEIKHKCLICLEGMTEDTASTLTCAHVFHGACIENVRKFAEKKACPMCRKVLTTK